MITFVFGSNLAGIHGKGAALHAKLYYGAVDGIGQGLQTKGLLGMSYAIPTKNTYIKTMPLKHISRYVDQFLEHAHAEFVKWGDTNQFLVTQIGCGLAGYKPHDIAPMFDKAPPNCFFARPWSSWLV